MEEQKVYICGICGSKYDDLEAEMINFECCDAELNDEGSNPKESGDDSI
ncbi:MAG: hypothetical protein HYS32_01150 [Candidatus Woesearchaeota archaeon]|nr:MAG: hypothetical protein HYS32_01150 [Candidatus Woesearchaeota archaeon]